MVLTKRSFLLVGLALVLASCVDAGNSPRVTLDGLGTLVGKEARTRGDRLIHSFQGIPFAEAPSGQNRFKAPIPKKWSGDLEATSLGIACPQPAFTGMSPSDRAIADDPEDCLTLNVYTPDLTHNALLPVVVFFHGGAFISGSAAEFGPEYLLDRDVVLVVPQYRIGAFGFLAGNNDIIPGNAGLLDALLALRWVKQHIGKFGGDVKQTTIGGHSAGASITNYLMISPLASGLFQRVILNSGTAIADWAINRDPKNDFEGVAAKLQCMGRNNKETDSRVIAKCIMDKSAEKLVEAHFSHYLAANIKSASPVISLPEPLETKIVPMDPLDAIKFYTNMPLLLGTTRHESMWMVNIVVSYLKSGQNAEPSPNFYKKHLFKLLYKTAGIIDDDLHMVDDLFKMTFFSYISPANMGNLTALIPGLVDIMSTVTMKNPAVQLPRGNLNSDTYMYSFDFDGRLHIPGNGIGDGPEDLFKNGIPHGDDMIYLTPKPDITVPLNEEEVAFSKKMVDLWANFIISGNPNGPKNVTGPEWPKFDYNKDRLFYKINRENTVGFNYNEEESSFVHDYVLGKTL